MSELSTRLQGIFAHQMFSQVKAFMAKIKLLSRQVESKTLTYFPILKDRDLSDDQNSRHASLLQDVRGEFSRKIGDFKAVKSEMLLVSCPGMDNAPSDVQMELIDLQSNALLAEHFRAVPLLRFYSSLSKENFPQRSQALRMLVLFEVNRHVNRHALTE